MGGPQGGTDASALERAPQVGRPAPREVDEIGLADRLGGRLVAGLLAVPDQEWLDLRPEAGEMFRAEIGPAPEDRLAVGGPGRRRGGHPRARAGDRGGEAPGGAMMGWGVVFLDGTIVNIALPRIGATLPAVGIGVLEGQVYVVAGYMATLAAFLLLAGALGDRYGRRRVFVIGLAGFGVTSLACGLAPTLDVLAAARLLQGITGALLVPGSLALITAIFEGPERGRAFGIWASATSALAIVGPPIGGAPAGTFR